MSWFVSNVESAYKRFSDWPLENMFHSHASMNFL